MEKIKEIIAPYFTKELEGSVYDLVQWKNVDVVLRDYKTGNTILDMKEVEFPEHFSQSACDIIASKYFRKKGVPNERGYEYSFRQVVHRMVDFWTKSLLDEGIVKEDEFQGIYNELAYMMLMQMWAPNSPQWFNTGLYHSYGINGSKQGHYYYDEKLNQVVLAEDAYTRTQGSACFILGVEDSLLGDKSITDAITTETRLFKYGSGVGSNWSNIRAKNELLAGGGKSSGLMSFLKVFDANAGAIKSGGTTRRAAKMNILDVNHPEIEAFISWKSKEEDKVRALGKMGYDTHFDGEAYATVSGQNANNSIRLSNEFMEKLDDEQGEIELIARTTGEVVRTVKPSDLFGQLAQAAWNCGDPGVQFDDIINDWNTCPMGSDGEYNAKHNRINGSNPCSEYMFLDDTACNLASINLMQFYDAETGRFKVAEYSHCARLVQLVLEATIHWGQYPTEPLALKSYQFRTTGLGFTNLGAVLMNLGLPYDSEEARAFSAALMSILTGQAYLASTIMARQVGPFECYELNKRYCLEVLKKHMYCTGVEGLVERSKGVEFSYQPQQIEAQYLMGRFEDLLEGIKETWLQVDANSQAYGLRNAQVSVLAPTGTIAFAMDCATTSSEPFFSHVVYKKLVGGSSMEIVNPMIPAALKTLGYTDEEIEAISEYVMHKEERNGYMAIADGKIEGAPFLKEEHYAVFDTANRCGTGERYIQPEGHVKMMAALMPHVSGAISKTVNMPNDATVEEVANIYRLSWELGVKAIALYRDGCKASQPLNSMLLEDDGDDELSVMSYDQLLEYAQQLRHESGGKKLTRIKPVGIRKANVHAAEIGDLKLYITVSHYDDGGVSEVYISAGRQGTLVKGLLESISTTVSKMLQFGIPATDIARMYRGQKFEPNGLVMGHPYIKMVDSISDLISKIIDIEMGDYTYCQVKPSNYEGQQRINQQVIQTNHEQPKKERGLRIYGEYCPECKSDHLVKNGTCKVCQNCGATTGCS